MTLSNQRIVGVVGLGVMGGAVARVVEGGYRVSGRWQFASGHGHCAWMGGHCRVQEPDGSIRLGRDGQPIERTMLFPHDAAQWTIGWDVIGLRGTGQHGRGEKSALHDGQLVVDGMMERKAVGVGADGES